MRQVGVLFAALSLVARPVQAQETANEKAYRLTLMCSVVAAHFNDEAAITKTADAVRKMGGVQGYSNERVSTDLTTMAGALGVEERNTPGSLNEHRNFCRTIGLAD